MKRFLRSPGIELFVVGLLAGLVAGCDTFAPPPKRGGAPPTSTAVIKPGFSGPTATGSTPTSTTTLPITLCTTRVDRDGDGLTVPDCPPEATPQTYDPSLIDCDDSDATRGQREQLFIDTDGDGYGSAVQIQRVCAGTQLEGYVANGTDCSDSDPNVHTWVLFDADGDGFGVGTSECGVEGAPWVAQAGDCEDANPTVHPGADEVTFDAIDSNCDGYEVPAFEVETPGEVIAWTDGALCSSGVLAVVAIERSTRPPGGVYLQIANIGTQPVSNATLVLSGGAPASVTPPRMALPPLAVGEVTRSQNIDVGRYEATFEYANSQAGALSDDGALTSTSPASSNPIVTSDDTSTNNPPHDAAIDGAALADAGITTNVSPLRDASADDANIGDTGGSDTSGSYTGVDDTAERCERAQGPFAFSSARIHPW